MHDLMTLTKRSRTRRVRGSLSRDEIVSAAIDIIHEKGIRHLSMRKVAERLQCSVAAPYTHFNSKEEIFRVLITDGEKTLTRNLKKAQASSEDVYAQLAAIAYAYWDFAAENRQLHKLMFNASSGTLYRKALPVLPTSYRVFLETIRKGILTGAIPYSRKSYPAIARTMWSWMYGLIVLEMNQILRRRADSDPVQEGIALFHKLLRAGEDL